MAETTYTYSIANDFPATGLNTSCMISDIQGSSIITAVDRIDTNGDQCNIVFKDALSAADKTTLDGDLSNPAGGLIAAHSGQPLPGSNVIPVKLQPSESASSHLLIRGAHAFEAELNGDTESVYSFTEDAELQGVSVDVQEHNFGDSLSFELQAPTGQPAPNDWVTVATFSDHAYVPHKGRMDITSEGSSTVPAGLRVLVTYHSTATVGFKSKIVLNYREWVED